MKYITNILFLCCDFDIYIILLFHQPLPTVSDAGCASCQAMTAIRPGKAAICVGLLTTRGENVPRGPTHSKGWSGIHWQDVTLCIVYTVIVFLFCFCVYVCVCVWCVAGGGYRSKWGFRLKNPQYINILYYLQFLNINI